MPTLDEQPLGELLSAYIDGELSAEEAQRLERILLTDADAKRLLDDLRRTVKLVTSLPRHQAPASIADEVRAQVERSELLGGVDSPAAARSGRRSPLRVFASMAAMLCVITVGWWVVTVRNGPTGAEKPEQLAVATRPAGRDLAEEKKHAAPRAVEKRGVTPSTEAGPEPMRGAAPATPSAALAPEAIRSDGAKGLVETASFEQKLRAGMEAGAVRSHAFENETVRLQVTVKDTAEREAVAEQVATYLRGRRLVDLADAPSEEADRAVRTRSFFYQGGCGSNFARADEQQILVSASREDLAGLMEELGREANRKDRVTLQAGPLFVRGLEQARTAFYRSGASEGTPYALRTATVEGTQHATVDKESQETAGRREVPRAKRAPALDEFVRKATGVPLGAFPTAAEQAGEETAAAPTTVREVKRPGDAVAEAYAPGDFSESSREPVPGAAADSDPSTAADAGARGGVEDAAFERKPELVKRRLEQLTNARRAHAEVAEPSTRPEPAEAAGERESKETESLLHFSVVGGPDMDPYVTLVVQFIIDKAKPAKTTDPSTHIKPSTIRQRE